MARFATVLGATLGAAGAARLPTQPQATRHQAADYVMVAPTAAPALAMGVFARQTGGTASDGPVCGWVTADRNRPVSCVDTNKICATNAPNSVHGCCLPQSLDACVLPTTCIPSSSMEALCTADECSQNAAIAKCTSSDRTECHKFIFLFTTQGSSTLSMTEWACNPTPITLTVERWWTAGEASSAVSDPTSASVVTKYVTIDTTPPSPAPTSSNSTHTGAIAGGVVGGLAVLSAAAFGVLFLWRKNKRNKEMQTAAQVDGERSALNSAAGAPGPSPEMVDAQSKLTPELMGNAIQPNEEKQKHVGEEQEPVEAPAYASPVEAPSTPVGEHTSPVEADSKPVARPTSPVEAPTERSPTR